MQLDEEARSKQMNPIKLKQPQLQKLWKLTVYSIFFSVYYYYYQLKIF